MRDLEKLATELRAGKIDRFDFLRASAGLGLSVAAAVSVLDPFNALSVLAAGNPNVTPAHPKKKAKYKIGFSQSELNNPWRTAESSSMQAVAAQMSSKYSYVSLVANSDTNRQVNNVGDLIAQKCDLIVVTPREELPLRAATQRALAAGIPVIEIDRDTAGKPGVDYICAIESNFIQQGNKVGQWMVQNTKGPINYVELRGSTGATPAIQRGKGFHDVIGMEKRFKQLASEDGDFVQATAKTIMTNFISRYHNKIDMVFCHNDAMTLGVLQAMKEAGFTKKVYIGTIDGLKDAIRLVAQGKVSVCVQSDPHFGPITFQTIDKYFAGEMIPGHITVKDHIYVKATAASLIGTGF